jgi:hypothetical protein
LPTRCWFDAFSIGTAQLKRYFDGLTKTETARRQQIQSVEGPVLDPVPEETFSKRSQKVKSFEILFQIETDLPWKLELERCIFARLLFLPF